MLYPSQSTEGFLTTMHVSSTGFLITMYLQLIVKNLWNIMSSQTFLFSLFLFCLSILINPAASMCRKTTNCGTLGSLKFPLTDSNISIGCGIFHVNCSSSFPIMKLGTRGASLEVHNKTSENSVRVVDRRLFDVCPPFFLPPYTPIAPLASFAIRPNMALVLCSKNLSAQTKKQYFQDCKNYSACDSFDLYYRDPPNVFPTDGSRIPTPECRLVHMPVKVNQTKSEELLQRISPEFELEWNVKVDCLSCHHRGGICAVDVANNFWCKENRIDNKKLLLIVGSATMFGLISTFIILFVTDWRRLQNRLAEHQNAVKALLKDHGKLAPTRYRYSELKKMTNSFIEKLGKGGYGSVYKGKLPTSGYPVAVKILSEITENGEEFLNEVASISRTSHVNIVTLVGYCIEGSKRALIYEYMPNGSLEKFIQHEAGKLGWDKLFDIAVGTARGLEYLHQGCNMRILHFDIKPHNILLDKDFNPKISDFGLAKLCPNRSSLVSMMVARGTIGYIAPEVFCRNFGGVSHKSDVYSYGMMVLEMAVGRQSLDNQASDTYFPDWIYKRLEEVNDRVGSIVESATNEEELELGRKLIIVGLWCIQTEPKNRPSMSKVVEMLSMDYQLEVPPLAYVAMPTFPLPHASFNFSHVD